MSKQVDDEKDEVALKFDMTKKGYEIFVARFKAYEAQKEVLVYTVRDPGNDLLTTDEYTVGKKRSP